MSEWRAQEVWAQREKYEQGDLWQLGGILVVKPEGKVGYHFISSAAGDYSPETDLAGISED